MTSGGGRPLSLTALGSALCASTALWVSFGAVTFPDAVPRAARVGLLPPLTSLVVLIALALAITLVVRPSARDAAPLWLCAVLLLPWAPFPVPMPVFIWTGTVRWWLLGAVAAAVILPILARRWSFSGRTIHPGRTAVMAGVLAGLAFLTSASITTPRFPAGDEPHYLIIAQSLIQDHDLRVENNYQRGDQLAYYAGALKPDYLRRGADGEIYSIHAPGLPFLIAPVFALFGYGGVKIALLVVSAAASALAWLLAWRVTHSAAASWYAWAAVSLSSPFFFHAFAVYPDAVGAAIVLVGVLPLVDERWREPPRLFVVGTLLAMLPWLHARFALAAAADSMVIVGRLVGRPKMPARLAALFAAPVVGAIGWFAFFQIVYGTPDPSAPYAGIPQESLANLGRGLAGLAFDQQFGLLANAPVFLCSLGGIVAMVWRRDQRRLGIELLIVGVPYVLAVGAFNMWWGGYSAPARFLVPITLLLAIPTAVWFAGCRTTTCRTFSVGMLLLSLMLTTSTMAIDRGIAILNNRDGSSELLRRLSPIVDLSTALPTLFQGSFRFALTQAAVWLAIVAAACAFGFLLERRRYATGVVIAGIFAFWVMGAMAAASLAWQRSHAVPLTPQNAALDLLDRYDPDARQIALSWRPLRRLPMADLPGLLGLVTIEPSTVEPGYPLMFLTHAPAAIYQIEGIAVHAPSGRLRVAVDRQSPPLEVWDVASFGTRWQRTIAVPTALATLRVDVDSAARASIVELSVRAIAVPGSHDRPGGSEEARRGARYGPDKLFLLSGRSYLEPEGVWVGGPGNTDFVVTPDSGSPIQLFVRNAPTSNRVTLTSGAWREELVLRPGEERLIGVPAGAGAPGTRLSIANSAGARPMDFAPPSRDARSLGCWIELR